MPGQSYESYLQIPALLGLQKPLSEPQAHDELQFIIVHQVYELWFKLLMHEVGTAVSELQAGHVGKAYGLLRRGVEIARVLVQQVHVIETMSPAQFLEFRDCLMPASGLQSAQFRALEYRSGIKDPRYLQLYPENGHARELLERSLAAPTLWDGFISLLQTRGFKVDDAEAQLRALEKIYLNDQWLDLHQLAELLVEYDEAFRIWRTRHFHMAERMIGFKPGTGVEHTEAVAGLPRDSGGPSFHDPGVKYLRARADFRFFPLLWELRTRLGSKSSNPG